VLERLPQSQKAQKHKSQDLCISPWEAAGELEGACR
jgi:hypothetical protein